MAAWLRIAPDPGDRGEPDVKQGTTGGSVVGDPRLVAERAPGARPRSARLPVLLAPDLAGAAHRAARDRSRCGFCDHAAIALDFLREDVFDAPANDVVLVARVA